jgi:pimeloyl-ACP methyl ester carboxylesterase
MRSNTCVLVHGNPETASVWDLLDASLTARGSEVVRLSPPGFGAPLPAGFRPDAASYANWLAIEVASLAARSAPDRAIDVVGHDWGAGHVYRLAATRPDLMRSWAADVGGLLHPDHVWHDAATAWQTPGVGEEVIDAMMSMTVTDRSARYLSLGLTKAMATDMAGAMDADMGRAILELYRSSPEPALRALAAELAAADHGPGLIITASDDSYVAAELAGPVAERLGVEELVLAGQGHWWMVSDPDTAADGLVAFWSSLD